MTSLSFFCACVPPTTTHHHKRIVRVGRFSRLADKPELLQARAMLEALLLPHQPRELLAGGVRLELEFTWPWSASTPKYIRALGRIGKLTKPDCSNLAKTLEDRLVALQFIEDDAHVISLDVRKWQGDPAGIRVTITRLNSQGQPFIATDPFVNPGVQARISPARPLHGLFPLENPS